MADIALEQSVGASPEVTSLATQIRDAQDPEIQQMRGWLQAWGETEMAEMGNDHAGMDDMGGMDGIMSPEDMTALKGASGAAFDRMWTEMMVRHHEGAIKMAEGVKSAGVSPDVKTLAEAIIRAQKAEIEDMRGLLA